MHALTSRQEAQLRVRDLVWRHIHDAETRRLHNSLATCVMGILSMYPRKKKRDSFVKILATAILEFDINVPPLAAELGMEEEELCSLFAKAAFGHENEEVCGILETAK